MWSFILHIHGNASIDCPLSFTSPRPPPTFLPDEIPQTNPTSASQQAKLPSSLTRPKYESLIDKLKLQSQATTQDLEYSESSSSSSSSSSNASASASASADKGKHTDRSWRDLSVDKKKEMMVLEARRWVGVLWEGLRGIREYAVLMDRMMLTDECWRKTETSKMDFKGMRRM